MLSPAELLPDLSRQGPPAVVIILGASALSVRIIPATLAVRAT